jgi:hypothetical protein
MLSTASFHHEKFAISFGRNISNRCASKVLILIARTYHLYFKPDLITRRYY